jgi:hypothetical protein
VGRAGGDRPWRALGLVVAAVLVIVLIAGGLTALRWWRGWDASISAPGLATRYADDRPLDGITHTTTATSSRFDVTWAAERELTLEVELQSHDAVRVTAVELPVPIATLVEARGQVAGPSTEPADDREPFHAFELRPGAPWRVRTTYGFVGCREYVPGSGLVFDHLVVTYEAKGRTRHRDVALASLVAVTMPEDAVDCGPR